MIGLVALGVYVLGAVAFALVVCRQFAKDGALDYGDIGGALFGGLGWPILAPFVALVWAVSKVLPLLGIEVKR